MKTKTKSAPIAPKSQSTSTEAKEYDHRVTGPFEGVVGPAYCVEKYKEGEWHFVKIFSNEKEAQQWMKGGVAPTRYK